MWALEKHTLNLPEAHFTLMGDNEEVLIVDLTSLHFTLQHLGRDYFVKLRDGKKETIWRLKTQILKASANSSTCLFIIKIQAQVVAGVFYLQVVPIDDSSFAGVVHAFLSGFLLVLILGLLFE